MKLTSDSASKRLKMLQDDYDTLLQEEEAAKQILIPLEDYRKKAEASEGFKTRFDFYKMQGDLARASLEIENLKHAINLFNVSTLLPKHNITIDQALVRMAFLSKRKKILREMRALPDVGRSPHGFMRAESADVQVCAFNQDDAKVEYRKVCDQLSALQQELNYINVTVEFDYEPLE